MMAALKVGKWEGLQDDVTVEKWDIAKDLTLA